VKRFDHVSPNQTIALSGSGSDGLARLHFEIIGLTKPGDILKLLPNKGHFRFELSPVEKIRLVQIILAGYDEKKKIEPTGVLDSPTIKAIRAYEKEMGMPLGGTVSDQLIKSLVSISGLDRAYEFDLTPARTSKHE
jgi:murein DD-endopeptidase MepM/ murein hydrolase activator NlpD